MCKIRKTVRITLYHFSGWRRNPRVWLTFTMAFVLALMLTGNAMDFSDTYGTTMQIFEPFIWTFGDAGSVMIASFLLLILFGDIPFITNATPYWLIRCSRKIWLAGQILYVFLAVLVYVLFFVVTEGLLVMTRAFIGNVWSPTSAMLGYGKMGEKVALPASLRAMEGTTPYECVTVIFLLVFLYCLFLAAILLLGNLSSHRGIGSLVVIGVNVYGLVLNPVVFSRILHLSDEQTYYANVLTGWLSPLNHATYYMHNFGYDLLPGLWTSAVIFSVVTGGILVAAFYRFKTYNFTFVQTGRK